MSDLTPAQLGAMHADAAAEDKLAALATETRASILVAREKHAPREVIEYLTAKAARLEKLARALREGKTR